MWGLALASAALQPLGSLFSPEYSQPWPKMWPLALLPGRGYSQHGQGPLWFIQAPKGSVMQMVRLGERNLALFRRPECSAAPLAEAINRNRLAVTARKKSYTVQERGSCETLNFSLQKPFSCPTTMESILEAHFFLDYNHTVLLNMIWHVHTTRSRIASCKCISVFNVVYVPIWLNIVTTKRGQASGSKM